MALIESEDRDGGVRLLRFDNGKPNAVSPAFSAELTAALEAAEKEANAVVLTGRPGMFSAGFDLGVMGEGPEAAAAMVKAGGWLALAIRRHPRPVVAACSGHAVAMGLFLVMASDYRIGAGGAFKLVANETSIGMTLPDFAVELARGVLSKRHFDRAIVHSTIYDPAGAMDAGMLDEVVEPDALEARALEVAAKLGALPQPAYRNNKRLVHGPVDDRIASNLDENVDALMNRRKG